MGNAEPSPPQSAPNGDPSPRTLRRIRRAGHYNLLLLLGVFLVLGIGTHNDPESPYGYLWGLVVAHLVWGRAANAAVGKQFGFSPWFIFFQASMIDIILMCYLWPLLVEGHRHARRWPIIGPYLDSTHRSAQRHVGRVGTFGDLGLLVFVVFPFWCTGPLVGASVGYLTGMPTWRVFLVVILGNTVAIAAWITAYDYLHAINPALALTTLGTLLAVALTGGIYRFWRSHNGRKKDKARAAGPT